RPFQGRALPVSYPGTVRKEILWAYPAEVKAGNKSTRPEETSSLAALRGASDRGNASLEIACPACWAVQFAGSRLLQRLIEFAHPVFFLEQLAGLGAFGRADDSVLFHQVDEPRSAAIADAQPALER